jgi:DNA ligase-associated metallophosphoesterase
MKVDVFGEEVALLWQKAIVLPRHRALIIADLHFGKVNHFRRSGIPVPAKANHRNTETLIDLLNTVKPERVIFLGDLFHSHYNEEWDVVGQILHHFPSCRFELVRGNHDILSARQYQRHNILVHQEELVMGKFLLTHAPLDNPATGLFNLAGHLHPGVRLTGKGRQAIALPCFYFGQQQGILPAFGSFTGIALLSPKRDDHVFVIADNQVQKVGPDQ